MFFEGREDGEYICRFQAGSPRRIGGKAGDDGACGARPRRAAAHFSRFIVGSCLFSGGCPGIAVDLADIVACGAPVSHGAADHGILRHVARRAAGGASGRRIFRPSCRSDGKEKKRGALCKARPSPFRVRKSIGLSGPAKIDFQEPSVIVSPLIEYVSSKLSRDAVSEKSVSGVASTRRKLPDSSANRLSERVSSTPSCGKSQV